MALKLGNLVAYLRADDGQFQRALAKGKKDWQQHGEQLKQSAAVAGVAIAAALGAGVAGALQLDAARAKLAAQVGDPALAKQLGEVAGRVYGRGFGESAAEAMTAARAVMQGGLLPKGTDAATIEDITVKAQALATALGADVTQAARAAGKMVQTGLAKDATQALDVLTRGMQVTGDQAGDLLETFSEYSTQFREVGIDGQKAMGMIAQAAQGGARDLDTAADAIKEFAIRSKDGSKTSADAFAALGLDADTMFQVFAKGGAGADQAMKNVIDRIKAMKDPVEQDAAVVALFGTKAEDLQDALFAMDPSTAVAGLGQVEGATKRAADTMENSAAQQVEKFKRSVQEALINKMAEALPAIQAVAGFLREHSEVVGPLAVGLGALALVIGTVAAALKVWAVVQTVLNLALWTSPVTWIVLAIIALVAVIVIIATKTTWFQTIWKTVWGGIKKAASAVGDWFVNTLWRKWILGAWNGIVSAGGRALDWFKSLPGRMKSAFRTVASILTAPFRAGFNAIAGLWNNSVGRLSFHTPDWVPGIGGKSFSLPQLPMLAKGGIVPATPGGRIVGVAEAGEAEAIAPLSKLAGMISAAVADGRGGEGDTYVYVTIDGQQLEGRIERVVRRRDRDLRRRVTAGAGAYA